jgi:GntR family transcriptional repressor for pyruvate dehydrogenase complex
MVRFESIEKQALNRQVVSRLTESILSRELAPGTLLPSERELTAQFGVSRTVIRESIQMLAALGMVDIRHGVGTLVNAPADWRLEEPLSLLLRAERQSLMNWMEVRKVVEVGFAGLAATRRDNRNLEALASAMERMQTHVHDPEAWIEADQDFHVEISRSTANSMAHVLMRPILIPLREYLIEAVRLPSAPGRALAAHRRIQQAIVDRQPDDAAAAMADHLGQVLAEIEDLYGEQMLHIGGGAGVSAAPAAETAEDGSIASP